MLIINWGTASPKRKKISYCYERKFNYSGYFFHIYIYHIFNKKKIIWLSLSNTKALSSIQLHSCPFFLTYIRQQWAMPFLMHPRVDASFLNCPPQNLLIKPSIFVFIEVLVFTISQPQLSKAAFVNARLILGLYHNYQRQNPMGQDTHWGGKYQ